MMLKSHETYMEIVKTNLAIPKIGCEVGVFKGVLSAKLLAKFSSLTMYMVDSYLPNSSVRSISKSKNPMQSQMNLLQTAVTDTLPFEDRRIVLVGKSVQVARLVEDGSLDFVFIDANHACPVVTKDINAWYPKVRSGGLVSGHDYMINHPPNKNRVKKAVDKFVKEHNYEVTVEVTNWWFVKR